MGNVGSFGRDPESERQAPQAAQVAPPRDEPGDRRIACASCGKMMLATATLCGFCWRRRGEPITAGTAVKK